VLIVLKIPAPLYTIRVDRTRQSRLILWLPTGRRLHGRASEVVSTNNDSEPIFYYCSGPIACIEKQMVGVINPVSYKLSSS
jgi:hypothetical protein